MCWWWSIHSGRTTSRYRSRGAERSDIEREDLGLEPARIDLEACHRDRQAETPRAGAARIEIEDAVAALDPRLVRVPGDDGVEARGAGNEIEGRHVVQDVLLPARCARGPACWVSCRPPSAARSG